MMQSNPKVLFIHIDFYDYVQVIEDKFSELGYQVDLFCEDPKINIIDKILHKISPVFLKKKCIRLQDRFIRRLSKSGISYDTVFVIKGGNLRHKFLTDLKKLNPKAEFILYMWDDALRVPNFFENRELYHKIYSFDPHDAEKYQLRFLPMFYCDLFIMGSSVKKSIDVYFSGWEHSNRREFLEKIIAILQKNGMNFYFHLYTSMWSVIKYKIKHLDFKKKPDYIQYYTIKLKENAAMTVKSRILIDIQHPTQCGLTMRPLDALVAKTKLITTNGEIVKYDFYDPDNIIVVNRENPAIPVEFFTTTYKDIPEEIVQKYSLANWIKTVMNGFE